ncbi:MAG: DUF3050 domain-containing protein [Marinibacterium sp.]
MDQTVPRLSLDVVDFAKDKLEHHPVYTAMSTRADLAAFMEHHVYSVWDFMSLIKYLHARVPPVGAPWIPRGNSDIRRFVNELLMEEESDEAPRELGFDADYISHFELYCRAMEEVGASPARVLAFIDRVDRDGIDAALANGDVPEPSRTFMLRTFGFLATDKPHVVAAGLAFGREHIIPWMFRSILADMGITEDQAPAFHYYLRRHIHLDADHHGPLSIALVEALCGGDAGKIAEAEQAARDAVDARVVFWDGVNGALT